MAFELPIRFDNSLCYSPDVFRVIKSRMHAFKARRRRKLGKGEKLRDRSIAKLNYIYHSVCEQLYFSSEVRDTMQATYT